MKCDTILYRVSCVEKQTTTSLVKSHHKNKYLNLEQNK